MKSNKILFILSILWGCFACTDGLEVIPENSVTFENYFKTEKDIETSLNALRDEFRSTCAFNANKTPIDLGFVHDTLRSTSAQKVSTGMPRNLLRFTLTFSGTHTMQ